LRFDELISSWRQIEELGFDWISVWDHLYPTLGTGSLEGPNIEATVALTSLAMVTERVRIGCLVFSTSMRNPANYWQRGLRVYDGISGRRHGGTFARAG